MRKTFLELLVTHSNSKYLYADREKRLSAFVPKNCRHESLLHSYYRSPQRKNQFLEKHIMKCKICSASYQNIVEKEQAKKLFLNKLVYRNFDRTYAKNYLKKRIQSRVREGRPDFWRRELLVEVFSQKGLWKGIAIAIFLYFAFKYLALVNI